MRCARQQAGQRARRAGRGGAAAGSVVGAQLLRCAACSLTAGLSPALCSSTTRRWRGAPCASCGATATPPSASRVRVGGGGSRRRVKQGAGWAWRRGRGGGGSCTCRRTHRVGWVPPSDAPQWWCRRGQHLHQEPRQDRGQQGPARHLLRLWQHPEVSRRGARAWGWGTRTWPRRSQAQEWHLPAL